MDQDNKFSFPTLRLAELLSAPGGVSSEEAVAAAAANMRALAGEGAGELANRIAEIDQILVLAQGTLAPDELAAIHARADQIVCLAATFGHDLLDLRARRLCDAIDNLPVQSATDAAFVAAHLQAIRLLSPQRRAV